jgi:hypothetical protein
MTVTVESRVMTLMERQPSLIVMISSCVMMIGLQIFA